MFLSQHTDVICTSVQHLRLLCAQSIMSSRSTCEFSQWRCLYYHVSVQHDDDCGWGQVKITFQLYKKISYRRRTARCTMNIFISSEFHQSFILEKTVGITSQFGFWTCHR